MAITDTTNTMLQMLREKEEERRVGQERGRGGEGMEERRYAKM